MLIHIAVLLNQPEFRLGEVLVPWSVIIGTLGFFTAWLVVTIMECRGLSRYVWHLPLFFLGLVVLFFSLPQALAAPKPDQPDKPNFTGNWTLDLQASSSLDLLMKQMGSARSTDTEIPPHDLLSAIGEPVQSWDSGDRANLKK